MLSGKAVGRRAVHRRDPARGWAAAARRRTSRRCSSSSTCASRSRAPTRRPSRRWRRRRWRCWPTRWPARTSSSTRRIDAAFSGNSPRRQPETAATVDQVGPGQVAGVLQGALRRREQLHLRLRRQLHARGDEAAGRDLHRQPAGDPRPRDVARPRHRAADRRDREDGREGHRAEEPGADRLLRAVRVRRRPTSWRCGR